MANYRTILIPGQPYCGHKLVFRTPENNKPLIGAAIADIVTIAIAFLIPGLRDLLEIVPLSLQE